MRFKGEVLVDGGKEADFSKVVGPIEAKQIQEWVDLRVVEQVNFRPR